MMDSKRERIPNLCSREAEGMVTMRERRVVMDSKRERIPNLCSREAEGMVTMLFSSEGGVVDS